MRSYLHIGLGSIVCRLQLRDIGNVSRHACSGDELSIGEIFQLVLLLFPPYPPSRPSTVEETINVDLHHISIVFQLSSYHGSLRPRNASVCNKDVKSVVEFFDLRHYCLVDRGRIPNVDLICST